MQKIHRFSPINNEKKLDKVLEYLTIELEKLSKKLFGAKLPINTLKIFPHYFDEHKYLLDLISKMGPKTSFSSDKSYYIETKRKIKGHNIEYLGVRIVDPYRPHVGCGDYEIASFEEIKKKYAGKSPYVRQFSNDMLEIWHPDFDILGYVVPPIEM